LVVHVSLDRDRFPTALADELNRADQVLGGGSAVGNAWQRVGNIDGRDPGACSGEPEGVRPALAAGSTGDQYYFSG
jgi:hypothetical protein